MRRFRCLFTLVATVALCAGASFAQDGKLKIKVTPKQAYIFVDGKAIHEGGSRTFPLSAGKHTVAVALLWPSHRSPHRMWTLPRARRPISTSCSRLTAAP